MIKSKIKKMTERMGTLLNLNPNLNLESGGVAEWSIATVLKTVMA
jgi:hypothetical protein